MSAPAGVVCHDPCGATISKISGEMALCSGFDLLRGESQKSDEAEQDQDLFHAETLDDHRCRPAFGSMIRLTQAVAPRSVVD